MGGNPPFKETPREGMKTLASDFLGLFFNHEIRIPID